MNESNNKRAVIVGIFVFIGIVFLLGGVLIIGNLRNTFKKKTEVVVLFDNVNGLQVGNNIWFSGIKVGRVSKLEFYGQSDVKVLMNLDNNALPYIRKDAFVKLSTDGMIGNKILVIYGGSSEVPPVVLGDTLSVEDIFTTEDMINTLQENNENLKAITGDFKIISNNMAQGEGTIGKLLTDNSLYNSLDAAALSLQKATAKANQLISSLSTFSEGLNKEGTLANDLTTDTVVFNSLKASVLQFQQMADTATLFVNNLKIAGSNTETSIGILLHNEETGANLKQTIKNLETSSQKLDEDLKAVQSNFLLRRYFKKKEKERNE